MTYVTHSVTTLKLSFYYHYAKVLYGRKLRNWVQKLPSPIFICSFNFAKKGGGGGVGEVVQGHPMVRFDGISVGKEITRLKNSD